jgi:glycosyltransferase involved in cell wall biosynthesis
MKVLVVASLFPPNVIGGAEMSAFNIAMLLKSKGHEVGVLSTAANAGQECEDQLEDGLRVWRKLMPRPYQMMSFLQAPQWQKPIWHLQDHFDPRNRSFVRHVLKRFRPDLVNINFLQGIGYNALQDFADHGAPVVYHLHDLGLACIRMSMFRQGHECKSQCGACASSAAYKARLVSKVKRIGFSSPSQANIDTLARFFPVKRYPNASILNPNEYPKPNRERQPGSKFRILFVGRIHETKGVDMLLTVGERLARQHPIEMHLIGNGPMLDRMQTQYGHASWCHLHGFLTQQDIANHMADSDVMCVPSIWAENSPGVVVHANQVGLPTVGSRKGGIPELVDDGATGCLVEPGNADAWYQALEALIQNPTRVMAWRAELARRADSYGLEGIYKQMLGLMEKVSGQPLAHA